MSATYKGRSLRQLYRDEAKYLTDFLHSSIGVQWESGKFDQEAITQATKILLWNTPQSLLHSTIDLFFWQI